MENLERNNKITNDDTSMTIVRESIEEIVELAMIDFLMLSALLKDLGGAEDVNSSPEAGLRISEAITQLQCMDMFTQKLSHISKLNDTLADPHSPATPQRAAGNPYYYNGFICRLNQFQVIAAFNDYTGIVTNIKRNLDDFHRHLMKPPNATLAQAGYFQHNDLIVRKLTVLISVFSDLSKNCPPEEAKPDPATREALFNIEKIYSIESERFVLHWLIDNTHGEEILLFDEYHNRFNKEADSNVTVDDIELF